MANKKSIFSCLRSVSGYLKGTADIESFRTETFRVVKDFVYEGGYSKYKGKSLFLELEPLDDIRIAKKMGISVAGVRQARKRISEEAYEVLGEGFADRIMFGTEHECSVLRDSIKMLDYVLSDKDFVFPEIIERLTDSYIGDGTSEFKLVDCKNELVFLSLFSMSRFSNLVDRIDSEKMNYLIRLISGQIKDVDNRMIALKYINSTANYNDVAKLIIESK